MDRIRLLRNPLRHYGWGSRTALAQLTGRPSPSAVPEAEMWMGAHPLAPSAVRDGEKWTSLDRWIARDPARVLGADVAKQFNDALPFLFKVLAPASPLSIQTHPDAEQARRGFERENRLGIGLDDPLRCYSDPNAKPELICALTRFEALCGFRPQREIAAGMAIIARGAEGTSAGRWLARWLGKLSAPHPGALRRAFGELMTLPQAQRLDLAHCTARAAARAPGSATLGCVVEIARHFPDDVGILAPLLLNRVVLEPGQALYLPAGELHAYLGGVGIELMGNSDNVIRGGLTAKHVDVPELLQTLRFRQGWPAVLTPRAADGAAAVYPIASAPGAHESHFELTRIELSAECPYTSSARASVEIALCTDGAVRAVDPLRNESVDVPRGAAVLLPAALPAYRLECIEGSAVVHRAGVAR